MKDKSFKLRSDHPIIEFQSKEVIHTFKGVLFKPNSPILTFPLHYRKRLQPCW